jgi:stage III sporulation protein AG
MIEKLKNMFNFNKEGVTNKKKIENLVFMLITLIVVVIIINFVFKDTSKDEKNSLENTSNKYLASNNSTNSTGAENVLQTSNTDFSTYNLEDELENTLSKITGVGKVQVLLTYSQTKEVIPIFNTTENESKTEEADTNGGTRTIEEKQVTQSVVFDETSGSKTLITSKIVSPKVVGALIVAEGFSDTNVKINIIDAVSALTGIATHKIQVLEMKE